MNLREERSLPLAFFFLKAALSYQYSMKHDVSILFDVMLRLQVLATDGFNILVDSICI